MKYENYQSIVKKILLKALTDDYLIKEVFFKRTLVPIPLHPSRFRERGFNQSEVIANVLSEITSCEVKRVLKRVKATKPMIELSPKERELNVKDAFCFKGSYLLKKAVIIDDVLTTGSTIYECARVLKKKGCNDISVFTISRAS
ncbi:MAG: ComF family protein [bacterium]